MQDTVTWVVQVNGKLRGKLELAPNTAEEALKEAALAIENVQKALEGLTIRKVIVIPGKKISIAASK